MEINFASVLVNDQQKALSFYTEKLGFKLKRDIPLGKQHWITVVAANKASDIELVLGPIGFAPARAYQEALHSAGIPAIIFTVTSVIDEYKRLAGLGVIFTTAPEELGDTQMAVFDDTCGNLIQIIEG